MAIYTVTLNTAIDVVISEKDYLEKNKKKTVNIPAGKGINVSRALKSAGIASTAIALVGIKDVKLFNRIKEENGNAKYVKSKTALETEIISAPESVKYILVLGAGGVYETVRKILQKNNKSGAFSLAKKSE